MKKSGIYCRSLCALCALLLTAAAPVCLAASDAGAGNVQKTQMVAASGKGVQVYNNESLTGGAVSYPEGSLLTVSSGKDGICRVYDQNGNIQGYCSAVNLVDPQDMLFYLPPYLVENGQVSDMMDLDYYLYTHPESLLINGKDDTILLQRSVIEALEKVAVKLGTDYQLWIEEGYAVSSAEPYVIDIGNSRVSFNTGCALILSVHDGSGIKTDLTLQSAVNKTMISGGFTLNDNPSGNGVYYYNTHANYLGVDIPADEMPMIAVKG